MKTLLSIALICLSLVGCSSAQDCKEGNNLLPMYGGLPKCDQQLKADKDFFAFVDTKFDSRSSASLSYAKLGWDYFYKNDLETSMKRFNQAWLLDSLNANVYWGFGNLLGRQQQFQVSIPHFEKSLKLKPNNSKVYESIASSYGQLFASSQKREFLDKAVDALKKADALDRSNARILSQLTSAYSYFKQKDSAIKYLKLTDKIDPKAINPQVRKLLKQN
ncbi:tetratricopeptide repeat protein [Pedobacter namyangjuensis]|uniref:tetratricopeptide repeat protein n=1 Tax=Pedobacter namyangjuensis TaxID=600626 RepID=UPI000DE56E96|nr:hypothetical protein [Pedobacter namyangjuensis]